MAEDLARWESFSTPTLSDALDRLGIAGQALGIRPLSESFRLVGRAFTLKYEPIDLIHPKTMGDFIDDVPPGAVIVIDNAGRLDCTAWGDILTSVAHRRGIAGTVIHGVCRDYDRSMELHYPIFSRGHIMRTGKDRVQLEAMNVPVSLGEVRVCPEDLLIGDADGVVVIPREREEDVYAAASDIERAEEAIRHAVESGSRLDEARREWGYFQLQSRKV